MTNKESIQAAHLEAIGNTCEHASYCTTKECLSGNTVVCQFDRITATSCTTITAEAIGEAMVWAENNAWVYNAVNKMWGHAYETELQTTAELVQLFLNQTPNTK